jgi:hypothetical protein
MDKRNEEIYAIMFKADEVELVRTECKQPWNCTCKSAKLNLDQPVCGYTPDQAKARFINYYNRRAKALSEMSTKQFMIDLGFYDYE